MKKIKLKKNYKKEKNTKWLIRHLNDEFFIKSKKEGYRSRAAYKLIQINEKFRIFRPGLNVLDLGAAPGGWCQVSQRLTFPKSKILGVDKLNINSIEGVKLLKGDVCEPNTQNEISNFFSKKVDVILSDMAPNTTGNSLTDHIRIINLVEIALDLLEKFLAPNGYFVCKIFQGGAQGKLYKDMSLLIKNIKYFKPLASRKESSETYLVGLKK